MQGSGLPLPKIPSVPQEETYTAFPALCYSEERSDKGSRRKQRFLHQILRSAQDDKLIGISAASPGGA
jgi:hypothetical protein